MSVDRKDIEKNSVRLVEGNFGKPDLYRVEVEGRTLMVKDVGGEIFFFAGH